MIKSFENKLVTKTAADTQYPIAEALTNCLFIKWQGLMEPKHKTFTTFLTGMNQLRRSLSVISVLRTPCLNDYNNENSRLVLVSH